MQAVPSSIILELILLFSLVAMNGILAMSEMAIVSSRKMRLELMAQGGDAKARRALELSAEPSKFLSTIQVGITLIGLLLGAFGGVTISNHFERFLEQDVGLPNGVADAFSVGAVVVALSYVQLIFGELVPKRLALQYPEAISRQVAGLLGTLALISRPFVSFLTFSTDTVVRLIGLNPAETEDNVINEELKSLVKEGARTGRFNRTEQVMVERVIDFGERKVATLMTPRPDVVWLDLNESIEKNKAKIQRAPHSHFPVSKGNLENLVGVLHAKDVMARLIVGGPVDLTHNLRQPLFVPESMTSTRLLEMFKQSGVHVSMVVDEYGMIQGLATLTDILEAIVGDMPADDGNEDDELVKRADGSWLVDGLMSIQEFREALAIHDSMGEERGNYHTLAGFCMTQIGRIPKVGEFFIWERLRFEVVDMDGNRVDRILVTSLPRDAAESEA